MREYASIKLIMIEFLNVPDAIHDIRLLHKLLSSCRDKDVFTTLSNS